MVSIMTALWFSHISGVDKVAVKPHASPTYETTGISAGNVVNASLIVSSNTCPRSCCSAPDNDARNHDSGNVTCVTLRPLPGAR